MHVAANLTDILLHNLSSLWNLIIFLFFPVIYIITVFTVLYVFLFSDRPLIQGTARILTAAVTASSVKLNVTAFRFKATLIYANVAVCLHVIDPSAFIAHKVVMRRKVVVVMFYAAS